jgi:hypothetical protein
VSGRPRQLREMNEKRLSSILFHLLASLQVLTRDAMTAKVYPPRSLPTNKESFLVSATDFIERSTTF